MAYVPDPTNVLLPDDSIDAETAQAEFRALKAYIAGLAGLGGVNFYRKNLFSNGEFSLDYLSEGAAVAMASTEEFICNRVKALRNPLQTVIRQRQALSTFPGLVYDAVYNNTVAGASGIAETAGLIIGIEGNDTAFLNWGAATAKPINISFQVKSPLAGTHAIGIRNAALNRSYVATYNVAAPNVAQAISVSVPGDVAGTWVKDNGVGMYVFFDLGTGTSYNAAAPNVWGGTNSVRTAACVKVCETVGVFHISGLQIEQSTAASALEIDSYAIKQLRNNRYFWKSFPQGVGVSGSGGLAGSIMSQQIGAGAGTSVMFRQDFPLEMRATPSLLLYNPINNNNDAYNQDTGSDCSGTAVLIASAKTVVINAATVVGSLATQRNFLHIFANAEMV